MENDAPSPKNDVLARRTRTHEFRILDLEAENAVLRLQNSHHIEDNAAMCAQRDAYKADRDRYKAELDELRGKYEALERTLKPPKRKYEPEADGGDLGDQRDAGLHGENLKSPVDESWSPTTNNFPDSNSKLGEQILRKPGSLTNEHEHKSYQRSPVVATPSLPTISPAERTNDPRKATCQNRPLILARLAILLEWPLASYKLFIVNPGQQFFVFQPGQQFAALHFCFIFIQLRLEEQLIIVNLLSNEHSFVHLRAAIRKLFIPILIPALFSLGEGHDAGREAKLDLEFVSAALLIRFAWMMTIPGEGSIGFILVFAFASVSVLIAIFFCPSPSFSESMAEDASIPRFAPLGVSAADLHLFDAVQKLAKTFGRRFPLGI
ncbi:hypothetical protein K438DRAFT_2007812 [Mycena galopus ATCC 62051]|nr:hypothetical protein K438DRAFT_2007812 [Mycena galopus ATCC 62051]